MVGQKIPEAVEFSKMDMAVAFETVTVTEGWLEIDKHYSLELCFSIENKMSVEYQMNMMVVWRERHISRCTVTASTVLTIFVST